MVTARFRLRTAIPVLTLTQIIGPLAYEVVWGLLSWRGPHRAVG